MPPRYPGIDLIIPVIMPSKMVSRPSVPSGLHAGTSGPSTSKSPKLQENLPQISTTLSDVLTCIVIQSKVPAKKADEVVEAACLQEHFIRCATCWSGKACDCPGSLSNDEVEAIYANQLVLYMHPAIRDCSWRDSRAPEVIVNRKIRVHEIGGVKCIESFGIDFISSMETESKTIFDDLISSQRDPSVKFPSSSRATIEGYSATFPVEYLPNQDRFNKVDEETL